MVKRIFELNSQFVCIFSIFVCFEFTTPSCDSCDVCRYGTIKNVWTWVQKHLRPLLPPTWRGYAASVTILTWTNVTIHMSLSCQNPLTVLDSTQTSNLSGEIFLPCSDFDPLRHSSPIRRPERTNPNNWRTMIINCRSLRGKVAAFQATVDYIQPDCILGCESWLDSSVSSSKIFSPAYYFIKKDRNCEGNGVFIATKKDNITSQLPEAESDSEAIWAKVHLPKSKSLVLGSVYCPPPVKLSVIE